jgi:hypothetical protein
VVGRFVTIQLPESTVSPCRTTNAMATWPVVSPVAPTTPAFSTRGVTDPGDSVPRWSGRAFPSILPLRPMFGTQSLLSGMPGILEAPFVS